MKKIFTLFALLVTLMPFTLAQIKHTANGVVDEQAQKYLQQAANKMSGTVSFTVTMISRDAKKKEVSRETAKLLYSSPRYRVNVSNLVIYCDGKTVWQHNKQAKEVMITNLTESNDDLSNPARLLSNYSKSFRAKFIRLENDGLAIIDLQPKKAANYHKVRLFINSKSGQLTKMELHNYDSTRGEYLISDFKAAKCADTDFVFDPKAHAGVEIIDMR